MKKILLSLSVVFALGLVSCGGVDSKIEKLNSLAKEAQELTLKAATGDTEAAAKLIEVAAEGNKLYYEISSENLTEEQKENLNKANRGEL